MHFFLAIGVPTGAVHGLVIGASVGMHDRVQHASFEVAGVSIDRSIRLLAETNFLTMSSMSLPSEDCSKAAAWGHYTRTCNRRTMTADRLEDQRKDHVEIDEVRQY